MNEYLKKIAVSVVVLLFPFLGYAQDFAEVQTTNEDSAAMALDSESYYTAMRLRLIRWIRKNSGAVALDQLRQSVELLEQADKFSEMKDFETAVIILETAFDVAKTPRTGVETESKQTESEFAAPLSNSLWQWTREVVAGIDYWQQQFELGFSEDSLYSENNGNPFTGLRFKVSKGEELKNFFSAYSLLKASRDYTSGELELRGRRAFSSQFAGSLENRVEGTSYQRDLDLQYWQNTSTFGIAFYPTRQIRVALEDEIRYRGYRNQSSIYPNYLHNQIGLRGSYSGLSTRLDAAYDYAARSHSAFSENDYLEHRVDAAIYQSTATNSSISLQNIWRYRDYARDFSDSTFQNTYQEEYLRGDFRIGLGPKVAIRIEGDYTLRQYEVPSSNTPDYSNTFLNPQVVFKIFGDLEIGAGYMYLLRVHAKDIVQQNATPVTDTRSAEAGFVGYEDYTSNGFTIAVELFKTNGLMLSLNNTYEIRKYPNSTTNSLQGLGLYTDRNINTLLLFLTMNLSARLQLSALAILDEDRSRIENQSDSKSTLFSVDLSYSF